MNDLNMRTQRVLTALGHYNGGIDGIIGPKTQAAIRAYSELRGQPFSLDFKARIAPHVLRFVRPKTWQGWATGKPPVVPSNHTLCVVANDGSAGGAFSVKSGYKAALAKLPTDRQAVMFWLVPNVKYATALLAELRTLAPCVRVILDCEEPFFAVKSATQHQQVFSLLRNSGIAFEITNITSRYAHQLFESYYSIATAVHCQAYAEADVMGTGPSGSHPGRVQRYAAAIIGQTPHRHPNTILAVPDYGAVTPDSLRVQVEESLSFYPDAVSVWPYSSRNSAFWRGV